MIDFESEQNSQLFKGRTMTPPRILSVAGSDSGGGAGIQADLKTFSALSCYGMTAITTVTAQNTQGVFDVYPLSAAFISKQMRVVLEDIGVDAVKIGMLHSSSVIKEVAQLLQEFKIKNVILDPVMVAQSGDSLIEKEAISSLRDLLFPLATLITPNLLEAEFFLSLDFPLEKKIENKTDMEEAAHKLIDQGAKAVLLKGGHLSHHKGDDLLLESKSLRPKWFEFQEIDTQNTHGTGCTLSSAIACFLGKRMGTLSQVIQVSKGYIEKALQGGKKLQMGKGHGPLWHFTSKEEEEKT